MSVVFRLRKKHWQQMRADAAHKAPEEACGLVAGLEGTSTKVYAVENSLHSPVKFRMDAQQQVDAFLKIEKKGWELAAIYHSHPNGPETPSITDIAEAAYPDVIHLIWSGLNGEWQCRGFIIRQGAFVEIGLEVLDQE